MTGWRFPWRRLVLLLICAAGWLPTLPAEAAGGAPSSAGREFAALERGVDDVEALVLAADFQRAITRGETTRQGVRNLPRTPESLQAQARLEVLLCTAQIALGDHSSARRSMQRAVYVWPLLALDERTTSPRVVKLFRAVKDNSGAARMAR